MFGSGLGHEQQVVTTRDLHGAMGPLGSPTVRRGARGIVRSGPHGLFDSRYTVEFAHGRTVQVPRGALRATGGRGEASFRRGQEWRSGAQLGLTLVIGVPLAWTLIRYYLGGGRTSGLIAAFPGAAATTCVEILSHAVSVFGLPAVAVAAALIVMHRRRRRR